MSFFKKLYGGTEKTRAGFFEKIDSLLRGYVSPDDDFYDELEEIMVLADFGAQTAMNICDELREKVKAEKIGSTKEAGEALRRIVEDKLCAYNPELKLFTKPSLILLIGVNGVGKTTTAAKLANLLKASGKKVILGAADTFRAAAIDQLKLWASRAGVDVIAHSEGSDPAAVVYDTIGAAKARAADVIICDTAGRLHNKKNLMDELNKIHRVIARELPDSSIETLLVLDAATGQNAAVQAREFKEAASLTGIVLTKLDGTAKGAVVVSIAESLKIPVKFVGVGEQMEDLLPFDPKEFVRAIFDEME